jgi:hypothetical protein
MRHYSLTDQLYCSDFENYTVSATAVSQVLNLVPTSKNLFFRNDGANDVFIAFDKDVATVDDFKLAVADGLVPIKVQCTKIALVCAAAEVASVRIGSNY